MAEDTRQEDTRNPAGAAEQPDPDQPPADGAEARTEDASPADEQEAEGCAPDPEPERAPFGPVPVPAGDVVEQEREAYAALLQAYDKKHPKEPIGKIRILLPPCVDHLTDPDAGNEDPANLRAALAAADAGFPVSPANPNRPDPRVPWDNFPMKAPLVGRRAWPMMTTWQAVVPDWLFKPGIHGGFHRASTNRAFVHYLWCVNAGALPMVVMPPGVAALDVDEPDEFPDGVLDALREAAGLIVRTPSGGEHLYFAAPRPKTVWGVQRGLFADKPNPDRPGERLHIGDWKPAVKGYLFAPGGKCEAGAYTAVKGSLSTDLQEIPKDLLAQVRPLFERSRKADRSTVASAGGERLSVDEHETAAPPKTAGGKKSRGVSLKRFKSYDIRNERLTPGELGDLPAGGRNNALNEGVFVDALLGVLSEAREQQWREAAHACGLGVAETESTIRSAKAGAEAKREQTPPEQDAQERYVRDIAGAGSHDGEPPGGGNGERAAKPPDSLVFTSQSEMADVFAGKHPRRDDFACSPAGGWFQWQDGIGWQDDARGKALTRLLMAFGTDHFAVPSTDEDGDVAYSYDPKYGGSASTAGGALKALSAMIERDGWDADRWMLGLPGCRAVNLKTGQVRALERDDLITMRAGAEPADDWRGGAWEEFIDFALPEGSHDVVRRLFGYALTGETNEEIAVLLYGTGNEGKSLFIDALGRAFGGYYHPTAAKNLVYAKQLAGQHTTWLASFERKRLIGADEFPRDSTWDAEMIKDWTSTNARKTARRMRQDEFTFENRAQLVILSNHLPRMVSRDEGMERRLVVLPFNKAEKEDIDPSLSRRIDTGQVLRWCLDGAREYWQAVEASGGRKGLPSSLPDDLPEWGAPVADMTRGYFAGADIISEFLNEDEEPGWSWPVGRPCRGSDVWRAFIDFCALNDARPGGRNRFFKTMRRAHRRHVRDHRDRILGACWTLICRPRDDGRPRPTAVPDPAPDPAPTDRGAEQAGQQEAPPTQEDAPRAPSAPLPTSGGIEPPSVAMPVNGAIRCSRCGMSFAALRPAIPICQTCDGAEQAG